jgi:hypothetical protein
MYALHNITFFGRTPRIQYRDLRQGPQLHVIFITLILLLLFHANNNLASVEYVSSEIDTGDNRQGYWAADMNGDSLQDILIATWSESKGRELLIYLQDTNGKFTGAPWRSIEIKKDIVAFSLADMRPDPGSELLLFTGAAAYSLSCAKEGYSNNLKKLFTWEIINSVPDKKQFDFMDVAKDLNNDGFIDILLPGHDQYALFRGQADEVFSKPLILPEAEEIINKSSRNQNNFTIGSGGVSSGGPDIYANLIVNKLQTEPNDHINYPPILNYTHWIPGVSTGRFNKDGLDDFIYLDDMETEKKNTKRLNLVYQSGTGELLSARNFQAEITINDSIKLMDINGDNITDIATTRMQGLDTTIYIFLNSEGKFNFDKPDHVIKLSGILSDFQAIDFNRDKRPELVLNTYSASPVKAVATGSVERRLFIFAGKISGKEGALFDRKPAFTYEENFTANNFKSLTGDRSFAGDIDGDGVNDVISVDNNGALTANRINKDLKLEAEPFFKFTPMHLITGNKLIKLNQDNRTDIIIEHQRSLSLITSKQGVKQ